MIVSFAGILDAGGGHADPVVPILLALVFLTLGGAAGGRLMTLARQPAVLGELLVGLIVGNAGYVIGNKWLTVLREGDALRRITDLALATNVSLAQAARQLLPSGAHTERLATAFDSAREIGRAHV